MTKRKNLEAQRDRILKEANEKAREILEDAKETADETIRNFHKFGKENISAAEMEKERERLRKEDRLRQRKDKAWRRQAKETTQTW